MGMSNTSSKELMLSQRSSDEEEMAALIRCMYRTIMLVGVAKVFVVFDRKG